MFLCGGRFPEIGRPERPVRTPINQEEVTNGSHAGIQQQEPEGRAPCGRSGRHAKKHGGIEETITVRRISYGVGVEKVFPIHAPTIEKIETVRKGKVRRAKLYYLRDRVGKSAKVKERI